MAEIASQPFLPGAHEIEGYGQGGFRFGGMSHRGSILALPSGIRAWDAATPDDITEASLAAVLAEPAGSVAHLLVGTGAAIMPLPRLLRQSFAAAGIVAEPMATAAAARTYSILVGERRPVAAALLAVG
jgi:uncharacterized protein